MKTLKRKILVVDDEKDILVTLKDILQRQGYEVILVSNGFEALEILHKTTVDLIITDIIMPKMEGLEFIQKVRSEYPKLPIVVMSGFSNDHYLTAALYFGAVCKLTKPFEIKELLHAIKCALDRANGKNKISTSNK